MTNPTSNFGWQMPESTDLVTNLPADFEVFGQAVDTDFVDLLGGTTGQVLSKTSNTDLDFTWVAANPGDITGVTAGTGISGGGTSGTVTVTNDMATTITAAGDIVVGTGSGTYDNLPIGTTNQILTADTTVSPYKVKWAAPAGGGKVLQVVMGTSTTITTSTVNTYATTTLSATITPSSATSKVLAIYNLAGTQKSAAQNAWFGVELRRAGTSIHILGLDIMYENASLQISAGMGSAYLDSPSTTSATTYEVFFKNPAATGTITVQRGGVDSVSTIILMEIGA